MESRLKSTAARDLSTSLCRDLFITEKIKAIICRAARDAEFAAEWGINQGDANYFTEIIPRMPKNGIVTHKRIRKLFPKPQNQMGDDDAKPGAHIAGLLFSSASLTIPQMYVKSKKIRTKQPEKVISELAQVFLHLDKELELYFMDGKYLKLIYSSDNHWAYVSVRATKIQELRRNERQRSYTLAEIKDLGFVMYEGKGAQVPQKVQQEIQKWQHRYADFLAQTSIDEADELQEALEEHRACQTTDVEEEEGTNNECQSSHVEDEERTNSECQTTDVEEEEGMNNECQASHVEDEERINSEYQGSHVEDEEGTNSECQTSHVEAEEGTNSKCHTRHVEDEERMNSECQASHVGDEEGTNTECQASHVEDEEGPNEQRMTGLSSEIYSYNE
eukprot:Seg4955.2 transcript_id=Seg4955.2/GoldUCD/mRNA.D3Y31 product="hypothetical protein" protein_id=Seg4955.2/GoldUCD/D3Y31